MKTIAATIRKNLESIRAEILKNIKEIVVRQKEYLEIYDHRGSLVVGGDDQESIVILSLEILNGKQLVTNCGVYEPEGYQNIEEYDIEMLCNILEACEHAEADLDLEKRIDESMQADMN